MRNLKKVLSLALSLVMLLGMMVVGAGAAEYKDAASIEYKEAADVLGAINVINGRDDGSFDPKAELSRAEGAAIIYRLIMGGIAKDPTAVSTGFTDVDGTSYDWASGYIAACAQQGILSGVGDNQFNPGGKLSGYAFGKMLLVALGYNADSQGYTGAGWEGNVFRDGYSSGITVDGVNMAANLTREQAAQMALQALTADMVDQDPSISVNGVVIPGSRPTPRANTEAKDYRTGDGKDTVMQLCELYFSNLKLNASGVDDFGRPVNVWSNNGDEVATASAATAVVTYTKKMSSVTKDLNGYTLALKKGGMITNGDPETGKEDEASSAVTSKDAIKNLTGNGKLVEVYATGKNIDKIVVVNYKVGKITVRERTSGTTYTLNGHSKTNNDSAENVILNGTVENGDYVTYAEVGDKWFVYPTETVEGVMSSYSNSAKTITVEGETYTVGEGVDAVAFSNFTDTLGKENASFYIDQFGFVVATAGATASAPDDFAYILAVEGTAPKTTGINQTGYTLKAQAVLADGTVEVYDVDVTAITSSNVANYSGTQAGDYVIGTSSSFEVVWDASETTKDKASTVIAAGSVWAYDFNSDNEMVLTKATPATSGSMTKGNNYVGELTTAYSGGNTIAANKNALVNSDTVFVVIDASKKTAATYTGKLPGVSTSNTLEKNNTKVVMNAATTSTATATVVFTTKDGVGDVATDAGYAYVDIASATNRYEDGKRVTYYTGKTADDEIDLTVASGVKVEKSGVYPYNDKNEITGAVLAEYTADVIGSQIIANGTTLNLTDDTQYVYADDALDGPNGNVCVVIKGSGDTASDAAYVFVIRALSDAAEITGVKVGNNSATASNGNYAITVDGKGSTITASASTAITVEGLSEGASWSIAKKTDDTGTGSVNADDQYASGNTAGATVFVITVTAENGDSNIYELTITSSNLSA